MRDQIQKNRLRDYLELDKEKINKSDFYRDSKYIYLGTQRPWRSLLKNDKQSWYRVKIPSEFNWLLWSSAGTYKSKLLQTILPYFWKKGYKICIFEGKDATLAFNLNKSVNCQRIYPDAYNTSIPTISHLPSYLVASTLDDMERLDPGLVRRFNNIITLRTSSIKNSKEWETLLGSTPAGSDILNAANKQFNGNLRLMQKQVRKGFVKDIDGEILSLHGTSKNSVLMKINKFITDEVFDSVQTKEMRKIYGQRKYSELNLEAIWDQDNIAVVSFMNRSPEYMKIYVQKVISQQYQYATRMLAAGKKPKILNIYDDCQLYLTNETDDQNSANRVVKNTIHMGRSYGFNNIFVVQDILEFNKVIYNGCTDMFLGYIRDFGTVRMLQQHVEHVEANRQLFKEFNMGSYTEKQIAYYHIPRNDNMATNFYPADPNCGGF